MSRWLSVAVVGPLVSLSLSVSTFGASSPPNDGTAESMASETGLDAGPLGEPTAIAVDGLLDSVSPDGRHVAGIGPDRTPCIWEMGSLSATCAVQKIGTVSPPSRPAMVWSPNSQRVAFTPDVFVQLRDGDVLVMDLDGTLVNLTDDGYEGGLIGADAPEALAVDTLPTWSPDGTRLAFVRDDTSGVVPTVMVIDAAGGEPVALAASPVETRFAIWPSMNWAAEDTILFTTNPADRDDPGHGVWHLDPSTGEVTEVVAAPDVSFELTGVDPDGTTALVVDPLVLSQYDFAVGDPRSAAAVTTLDLVTGSSAAQPWFDPVSGALVPAPAPEDAGAAIADGLVPPTGPQAYSPDGSMWVGRHHSPQAGGQYLVVGDVATGEFVGAIDLSDVELVIGPSVPQWVDGGIFAKSGAGTAIWVPVGAG